MPAQPGCPLSDEWLFSDPMQLPLIDDAGVGPGGRCPPSATDPGSRARNPGTTANPESVSGDDLSL